MVVARRPDFSLRPGNKRVVADAAGHLRRLETRAELDPLDCGDPEHRLGDAVFQAAEHGLSDPRRTAMDRTLDHAAYAVSLSGSCKDGLLEPLRILLPADAEDLRLHPDPHGLQLLEGDPAGDAQRRGKAAGKLPSPRVIPIPPEAEHGGEIRMSRPRHIPELFVIL